MNKEEIKERFDRCIAKIDLKYYYNITLDEDEMVDFYIDEDNIIFFNDVKTPYKAEDVASVKYRKCFDNPDEVEEFVNNELVIRFKNQDFIVLGMSNTYHDYFNAKIAGISYYENKVGYIQALKKLFTENEIC